MKLVRQIASRIRRRLPGSVDLDDLVQAGTIGLMAAIASAEGSDRRYSEAYLRLRIQGAILDSLREYDWASRYMRDRSGRLRDVVEELRQQLGREPDSEEVAERLDLDLQSYFELAALAQAPAFVDIAIHCEGDLTLDEFVEDSTDLRPDALYAHQELRRLILGGAANLSAEHCVVLLLYYFAEWTGSQVADAMQLSEARVSQIRSGALTALRKRRLARFEGRPWRIRNSRRSEEQAYRSERSSARSSFRALLGVIELCEPQVWQHCQRVEAYAAHLAHRLNYPDEQLPQLLDSALLHDIGKIFVPAHVLRNPSSLDSDEWRIMRRHVEIGSAILDRIVPLRGLASIVRHHHESFDGCGYPDRLCGEKIPLPSRIIAVADSLDAMTSDRVYRGRLGFQQAKQNILETHGRYDPALCEVFHSISAEEWAQIAETYPRR